MTAQPQFITNSNGDKTAVILTLDDYQELLEDLEDLAAIHARSEGLILVTNNIGEVEALRLENWV